VALYIGERWDRGGVTAESDRSRIRSAPVWSSATPKQSRKRKTRFRRGLSSMEESEDGDATVVPEIDNVPDVERGMPQSQPAQCHRTVLR